VVAEYLPAAHIDTVGADVGDAPALHTPLNLPCSNDGHACACRRNYNFEKHRLLSINVTVLSAG